MGESANAAPDNTRTSQPSHPTSCHLRLASKTLAANATVDAAFARESFTVEKPTAAAAAISSR